MQVLPVCSAAGLLPLINLSRSDRRVNRIAIVLLPRSKRVRLNVDDSFIDVTDHDLRPNISSLTLRPLSTLFELFFPLSISVRAKQFLRYGSILTLDARKLRAMLAFFADTGGGHLPTGTVFYVHSTSLPCILALPAFLPCSIAEALLISFLLLLVGHGNDDLLLRLGKPVAGLRLPGRLQD